MNALQYVPQKSVTLTISENYTKTTKYILELVQLHRYS